MRHCICIALYLIDFSHVYAHMEGTLRISKRTLKIVNRGSLGPLDLKPVGNTDNTSYDGEQLMLLFCVYLKNVFVKKKIKYFFVPHAFMGVGLQFHEKYLEFDIDCK